MVVVGYGQIIPQAVIDLAPLGIINVHASLLPKYRGAGPIQWAIVRGETRTGVTTMRIDAGLDTGDMLLKAETEIGPEENAVELGRRLAAMGADLLVETLEGLAAGQDRAGEAGRRAGHAGAAAEEGRRRDRLDASRRWTSTIGCAGCSPGRARRPAFAGRPLHVWKTKSPTEGVAAPTRGSATPGQLVSLKPLVVACGDGRAGTCGSATGRAQANSGRGFRERAAIDGQ